MYLENFIEWENWNSFVDKKYGEAVENRNFVLFKNLYQKMGILPSKDVMVEYEKEFGLKGEFGKLYSEIFDKYDFVPKGNLFLS